MKHVIYTASVDYDDYREDLEEQYPDATENERINIMYEMNQEAYYDEMENLNKELDGDIVIIASLGLWNGRRNAYKVIKDNNLNAVLTGSGGDITTWYVEDGEIKCEDIHHDGVNYYTYRLLTCEPYEFEDYVFEHSLKEATEKYTEPLGHYVAEIYGFGE